MKWAAMKTLTTHEACLRLAERLSAGGEGRVHSVFRTAANLAVDGRLISLLGAGRSLQPYGLVLAGAAEFDSLGLAPGAPVTLGGNLIAIGGAAPFSVSLEGAALRELSVQAPAGLCAPARPGEKLKLLAEVIAETPGAQEGLAPMLGRLAPGQFPQMPANHWCDFLYPRTQELPDLLRGGDEAAISEAGRRLAGCGPGLSPSSDDFLAGLAAGLWALDAANLRPGAGRAATALATGAAGATGSISAAFLHSAAEGLFGQDLLKLLAAYFSAGAAQGLRNAAMRVAAFGASSGADILSGLWYCLWLYAHREN